MRGTYVLAIEVEKPKEVKVGSLGTLNFDKGIYAYVGSAFCGAHRIWRHFKREKKKRWHIDYLLEHSSIKEVWFKQSRCECECASELLKIGEGVKGFGCSDCKCKTHLIKLELGALRKKLKEMGFRLLWPQD